MFVVNLADNISFYVDGELLSSVFKNPTDTVRTVAQIAPNVEYLWKDGTRLAPFDKEVSSSKQNSVLLVCI